MYSLKVAVSKVLGHVVMASLILSFFSSLTVLATAVACLRMASIFSGILAQAALRTFVQ